MHRCWIVFKATIRVETALCTAENAKVIDTKRSISQSFIVQRHQSLKKYERKDVHYYIWKAECQKVSNGGKLTCNTVFEPMEPELSNVLVKTLE